MLANVDNRLPNDEPCNNSYRATKQQHIQQITVVGVLSEIPVSGQFD